LVSDMLSSIKNSSAVGRFSLEMPYSKTCEDICKVLKSYGYLENAKSFKEKGRKYKMLKIELASDDEVSRIRGIKRHSKPGRRQYSASNRVKWVDSKYGVVVVSTSRGIMSGEEAKKKKLGGEVICEVW